METSKKITLEGLAKGISCIKLTTNKEINIQKIIID